MSGVLELRHDTEGFVHFCPTCGWQSTPQPTTTLARVECAWCPDAPAPPSLPAWPFAAMRDLGQRVKAADEKLAAVQALIDHARNVSPSDRMCIYVGDLEQALGLRDEPARTRTGSNG